MAGNRAQLLTPPGASAIAVVRIVGAGVLAFLGSHFSRPVAPGRCVHGQLISGSGVLDDPVVVLLHDGLGADLNLHGGPCVIESVLDLLRSCGFEIAQPSGEPDDLPLAMIDGATVLEKEIQAHLPQAQTELAARVLIHQSAAWADFVARWAPGPAEGSHLAHWLQRAQAVRAQLTAILADRSLHWLLRTPTVALIGAPNVGKSTLANRLFAHERVITADLPGTTRDWVGEIANLDGLAIMLVDTPGIRDASDPIEAQAIDRAGVRIRQADLVVVVLDASTPLEGAQSRVLEAWPDAMRVINKVDAESAWNTSMIPALRTVATTEQGVDELRSAIRGYFGVGATCLENAPRIWTKRQRQIVVDAQNRVELIRAIVDDK